MPDTTANEALLVCAVIAGGFWFGYALGLVEQVRAVVCAFQTLTLLSLVWGVTLDSGRGLGGWLGVFASRNTLTPVALAAFVAILCWLYVERPRRPVIYAIALVLALIDIVVAVLAGAQTPFVAVVGAGMMVAIGIWLDRSLKGAAARRVLPYAVASAVLAMCGALIVVSSRSDRFVKLLSNRTVLWRHVIEASRDHWFKGFGYGAFWFDKSYLDPLYAETNLVFDNAHNSVLEMLISGGIVGALAILIVLAVAMGRPMASLLHGNRRLGVVWLALACFCVFENMTEAFIVYQSPFWMLVVAAAVAPGAKRKTEASCP